MKNWVVFFSVLVCSAGMSLARPVQGDTVLVDKAREAVKAEDFPKALELFLKADKTFTPDTTDYYGNVQHNIGYVYYMMDDKKNAAKYWERALAVFPQFSEKHEKLLEFLGFIYTELNDTENGLRIAALTKEHNENELLKPCDEPDCMVERAKYYASTGDNANARDCFNKAREMTLTNEQKVKVYEEYAQFLVGIYEDFENGAANYLVAAKAQEAVGGKNEKHAMLMYKAAQFSFNCKNYQQSIDCYNEVIAFYATKNSDAALANIILCKEGLSNVYSALKDFEPAITLRKAVLEYYTISKPDKGKQAKAAERLANAEKYAKHYDEAIEHYKLALTLYDSLGDAEGYSSAASSLNLCFTYAGKEESVDERDEEWLAVQAERLRAIIKEELDNLQFYKNYLGSLVYAQSLATLGGCYVMLEDYANGVSYYKQYIETVRTAIRDEFRLRGEKDRMLLWEEEKKRMDEILELLVMLPVGNEDLMPELTAIAYDVELLSKGILLNSSIEFEQVLKNSDARLLGIYEETKRNDQKLLELRQTASSDKDLDKIQELTRKNEALQLELYRGCAEYADFTNYISYTWKDVQKALPEDAVAIEFAAIKAGIFDTENFMAALVITKDMSEPVVLPICNLQVAKEMEKDSLLFSTSLGGNMVWGPLNQYIEHKNKVFFSADGSFNRIAIEYLQWNGKPLFDQIEVYRMSSTKEICYKHLPKKPTSVAVFGNIEYNDGGELTDDALRSINKVRGVGEGFIPLYETEREILEIEEILKKANVLKIATFQNIDASEQAFKQISGSKVDILHIATHGSYKDQQKASDAESMQNSLLAFAGANIGANPDNDGIVTAADVAQMDLHNCDLVVLSACETALGKLSNDGVFGLQRGFKNAGVHTLLMSLKEVYDNSTADMMIAFYKHLAAGATKRDALKKAQQELRQNGFSDPEYWAAFILLDALE